MTGQQRGKEPKGVHRGVMVVDGIQLGQEESGHEGVRDSEKLSELQAPVGSKNCSQSTKG